MDRYVQYRLFLAVLKELLGTIFRFFIYRWSLWKNQSVWLWPAGTTSSWFRPLVVIEWPRLSKGFEKHAHLAVIPLVMTKGYARGVHSYWRHCGLFHVFGWQRAGSKRHLSIQLFQKSLSERIANGECRTEVTWPKGTVVKYLICKFS